MLASQFENIRVILAEPSTNLRAGIKDLLMERGFKNVLDTGNFADISSAVRDDQVDLLIGDTKLPEGDLSEMIHQIRHGEIGHNPFIVTITLLNSSEPDLVHRVIDSGTDRILVKPFNVAEIVDHIEFLTHSRKEFVVTTDYIGPNRRTTHRPGTMNIPQIEVPNPLRSRMTGQMTELRLKRSINSAMNIINEQKVLRHAFQIAWLMEKITGADGNRPPDTADSTISEYLERLRFVSADIAKRIKHTRYAHVTDLCMTLVNLTETVARNGFIENDMQMIVNLSRVIQDACDDARTDVDTYRSKSQSDFEAREKQPVAKKNSLLK